MKYLILFLVVHPSFSWSQNKLTENKIENIIKSNLILKDSGNILPDFFNYKEAKNFFEEVKDSSHSYVCKQTLLVYKGEAYMQKILKLNAFDSLCVNFVYDKVLKYKWKEKISRKSTYMVLLYFIYDFDEKVLWAQARELTNTSNMPIIFWQKINLK